MRSEIEIARLEWLYLPVLEHSRRPPVTLHSVMASNPEFFVEVLSAVYSLKAKDGDEESTERMHYQRVLSRAKRTIYFVRGMRFPV